MTREQMLALLGIADADFRDFLTKLAAFRGSLNNDQLAFFHRSLPTVEQVAQAFGPDCSVSDVEQLFTEAPPMNGICCLGWEGRSEQ
jgi:hypothetical protein